MTGRRCSRRRAGCCRWSSTGPLSALRTPRRHTRVWSSSRVCWRCRHHRQPSSSRFSAGVRSGRVTRVCSTRRTRAVRIVTGIGRSPAGDEEGPPAASLTRTGGPDRPTPHAAAPSRVVRRLRAAGLPPHGQDMSQLGGQDVQHGRAGSLHSRGGGEYPCAARMMADSSSARRITRSMRVLLRAFWSLPYRTVSELFERAAHCLPTVSHVTS